MRQALRDQAERDYLNDLPTTFVLPEASIDRLRAAAAKIILESPDLREVLKMAGAVAGRPMKELSAAPPPGR